MKTKILKVKITFLEPVLGTWPSNQNVARDFIASKSPDAATIEDEVAALGADAVADKGMTVFPRNENGEPVLYDYQIKGFFKDSCGMLARVGGKTETGKKRAVNESGKLSAYKKIIDGLIFPQPRMIPIKVNGIVLTSLLSRGTGSYCSAARGKGKAQQWQRNAELRNVLRRLCGAA